MGLQRLEIQLRALIHADVRQFGQAQGRIGDHPYAQIRVQRRGQLAVRLHVATHRVNQIQALAARARMPLIDPHRIGPLVFVRSRSGR